MRWVDGSGLVEFVIRPNPNVKPFAGESAIVNHDVLLELRAAIDEALVLAATRGGEGG